MPSDFFDKILEHKRGLVKGKKAFYAALKKKFDKDNATIRAERITAQQLSAEKLVEEELKIAEQEQAEKKVKNKKDASIKEAEELYQKLKKTGTLRK